MGLETGTYISDLVATNPTPDDPKSQGDDHLRLIKSALLQSLGGFPGAVQRTGVDGGAANAYTVAMTPSLVAYGSRMTIVFSPVAANTGTSTMKVDGLAALPLRSVTGAELVSGDLLVGVVYAAFYNGVEFRLLSITQNYVDQKAFSAALPAQAVGFLRSNGSVASFGTTHAGYAQNEVKGADIASAATINLTAATGNLVHVTGTTAITAITIPVGAERTMIFDGVLTLTNGAALLLPGAANIVTQAGDRALVRGDTAGAIVTHYQRADGTALVAPPFTYALLAQATVSTSVANIDFLNVFSSSYDSYEIVISGVLPSSSDTLILRLAIAGVVDTASRYFIGTADGQNMTSGTGISLSSLPTMSGQDGFTAAVTLNGMSNQSQAAKSISATGYHGASSGGSLVRQTILRSGGYGNPAALSGFRLTWGGAASFAAGTVRIYGKRSS